ncbi:hypothetical protein PC9H_010007 [Pleurotus ostreatus]|uniref:Uncharacterized protein n=1 Tax=Pleurotus ostreatus TaxID=5322 RepID=A0A8H6ZRR4_PLEOS|nr:uncharacterized protein PC9H_010007 [Pleurotus ostreatus]KAF7424696.1 hypothetical protein PC9H_010007 [Pleurotus ostreatus]KAJ8692313.1 hypothetical protein PTI98_009640 [Pleurotus ostreatus]
MPPAHIPTGVSSNLLPQPAGGALPFPKGLAEEISKGVSKAIVDSMDQMTGQIIDRIDDNLAKLIVACKRGDNLPSSDGRETYPTPTNPETSLLIPPLATTSIPAIQVPAMQAIQAPPLAQGNYPFVPPLQTNTKSILQCFPGIESSIIQSVVKHELRPQQLYKLITTTNKHIYPTSLVYTPSKGFHAEEPSILRELPTFTAFMKALMVYFDILSAHVRISTSNIDMLGYLTHGVFCYVKNLYHYIGTYAYETVLQFHMIFHAKRLFEMQDGDYSGWSRIDSDLVAEILLPSVRIATNVSAITVTGKISSSKDRFKSAANLNKEVCRKFQDGKCTSPCHRNRIHQCSVCSSEAHGGATCTARHNNLSSISPAAQRSAMKDVGGRR